MPQRSKLIRSREEWKNKAVSRANELRDRRKAEKRLRGRIAELKRRVEELEQASGGILEKPAPMVRARQPAKTRAVCVLLVEQAVVSYSMEIIKTRVSAKPPANQADNRITNLPWEGR